MPSVLIISPYYHPNINPRPYRWTRIAEYWASQGFDIQVITENHPNFEALQKINEVKVHRTGYAALKSVFLKKQRGEVRPNTLEGGKPGHILGNWLQFFNDYCWKKIYFPDDSCIWYFSALRKATQLIENQQIDILITSALPFTSHLIGLRLKERFPHLTWIADTGDPFSYQTEAPLNNVFLYQKINEKTERKVLQKADYVTVTTDNTKAKYIKFHKAVESKIRVIPPLMTESNHVKNGIVPVKNYAVEGKINLGYLGKFYKLLREPRLLADFLTALFLKYPDWKDKIVVHIFGDVFPYFLPEFEAFPMVKIHGLIPRETTVWAMQEMDILLNISNLTSYQLPSKAPDYLQSAKPVFNIYSSEEDEFKAFFEHYSLIFNYKNGDEINEKTIFFLSENINNRVGEELIQKMIKPYTVNAIATQYEALFL